MNTAFDEKITTWAVRLLAAVCVVVPFHAFLTVWAGSVTGGYDFWRLWVEVLLIPLIGIALWLLHRDRTLCELIRKSPLTWCLAGYVALHVVVGVWALATDRVNGVALATGLVLNLRLPAFFFVALVLGARSDWLRARWQKVLLVPAAIVVGFGLWQIIILPADFLRHFGYGPDTIAPFATVDQKLDYVRAQSTLRGANPLGAYLVMVLAALVVLGWRVQDQWAKATVGIGAVAALVVLVYTYSRSAYLGAAVAILAAVWWSLRSGRARLLVLFGMAALVVIGAGLAVALRQNDRFQNTFFHTDEHSQAVRSSNEDRTAALQQGMSDIVHEPWGGGPGTAGPASVHNDQPARIAENYFLQIGQEVGVLGLALFVAINVLIAQGLWRKRAEPLPRLLLASLLGLTAINMLSHAWTDETIAVLWWSLAGVALAPTLGKSQKT